MSRVAICPGCGHQGLEIFHEAAGVPTNSCILLPTREEAQRYPRGDIALGYCPACRFITNTAFDPARTEYSGRYEETQGFSRTFQRFHRDLAERLVSQLELTGRDILEIGCGKGEFLLLLCADGRNRGVGFDPAYRPDRHAPAAGEHVRFVQDFYGERYADQAADFVCCKMTLEHIQPTAAFMTTVRRALGDRRADVFFMIPETARILEDCAFEDVYYEHVSYFTRASLAELFTRTGFTVRELGNEYDGQYLTILASTDPGAAPSDPPEVTPAPAELDRLVAAFPADFARKVAFWRARLDALHRDGRRAVIWGSGSKGVSFLTTLELGQDVIAGAVDINPHRHGFFMPGTGHAILGPDALRELDPDVIIVMNAIYREEIAADAARAGCGAEILTLEDA